MKKLVKESLNESLNSEFGNELNELVKKYIGEISLDDFRFYFERWMGELNAAESGSAHSQFRQGIKKSRPAWAMTSSSDSEDE